ncbi:hypothetical protein ACRALDRAFT_207668 [Sodiomyces alcalophilus JCM 7366]|uniref:uncharacterized protein n=1 Tax=Sodiomyces alcalophilus JCM 7366 TaxID=591952 RepID=UPI0039B41818
MVIIPSLELAHSRSGSKPNDQTKKGENWKQKRPSTTKHKDGNVLLHPLAPPPHVIYPLNAEILPNVIKRHKFGRNAPLWSRLAGRRRKTYCSVWRLVTISKKCCCNLPPKW